MLSRHLPQCQLQEAATAADFARALGSGGFDVVITELTLSWSDGGSLLAAVHDSHPERPVLFFTTSAEVDDVVTAMKAGLADFLFKTSTGFLRLPQAVEQAWEQAHQRQLVARSEPWLQTLLDRADIGIFRSTLDERLIESNPGLLRLLGVSSIQEALEVDLPAPHFRSEGSEHLLERLGSQGDLRSREVEVRRPDGSTVWLSMTEVLLLDVDGEIVVDVLVQDVSHFKQTEARLEERLAELERSNAELSGFAATASHELREPLRMVEKYSALLADSTASELPADAGEALTFIHSGAVRMRHLVEDLLKFARIGTEAQAFEACDCNGLVDEAARHLLAAVEESGAKIERTRLPTVLGDAAQLLQVFQNLLANAIKFRGDSKPRIRVSAEREGDAWVFAVKDNGIGIDPEKAAEIFDLFHRLEPGLPGTGIGLSLCRRIVERHGGRIWVESSPGEGSVFRFTLPIDRQPADGSALPVRRSAESR